MEVVETLYTVALCDHPQDLPSKARADAEARYARELERHLGSAEQVAAALDTLHSLEDAPPEQVSAAELSAIRLWSKASAAARQAAMRDLGDMDAAYFEVQLS